MSHPNPVQDVIEAYAVWRESVRAFRRALVNAAQPEDDFALESVLAELSKPDGPRIHGQLKRRLNVRRQALRASGDPGDGDFTVIETPED